MNLPTSPGANSMEQWTWTELFALHAVLAVLDFFGAAAAIHGGPIVGPLVGFGVAFLMLGQIVAVLAMVGFGGTVWSWAYLGGVGVFLAIVFDLSLFVPIRPSEVGVILLLPALFVAIGAAPAWTLRFLFGWRLLLPQQRPAPRNRFSLSDLFLLTSVCAAVATAIRLSRPAFESEIWNIAFVVGAVLLWIGATLVPLCTWILVGSRRDYRQGRLVHGMVLGFLVATFLGVSFLILPTFENNRVEVVVVFGLTFFFGLPAGLLLLLPLRMAGMRLATEHGTGPR